MVGATNSQHDLAAGVFGVNDRVSAGSTRGVQGQVRSSYGFGVIGFLSTTTNGNGAGVYGRNSASTGSGAGIEGYNNSADGWAGRFTSVSNGVAIYAAPGKVGLTVSGGSKNAAVATSDGDRLLYSEESSEVWFSDYGFGYTQDGFALVQIEPVFAETVNLDKTIMSSYKPMGMPSFMLVGDSMTPSKCGQVIARPTSTSSFRTELSPNGKALRSNALSSRRG